jgi:hypothetical protein
MRANRAYDVPAYIQMAQAAWETVFNYTITPQQAATGNVGDVKNSTLTLAKQCHSGRCHSLLDISYNSRITPFPSVASLAGGTYAVRHPSKYIACR